MKKTITVALSLLLSLGMVGCSSKPAPVASTPAESVSTPAEATDAVLEDSLLIYSTHPEALLEIVAAEFTKETGVSVEFLNLKGELADRVRAEKENPQADIMYGGASSLFLEMSEEGLFAKANPTWAGDLNPIFKGEQGDWFGTMQTPVMMFYNSEMLTPEEAPKDWKDLADSKYKGKIVSRDTLSSSIRATLMSLVSQYETPEEGFAFLEALDDNMKNYYNSGTMQFQAVGKQEAPISFGVLSAITQNINDNAMPLQTINAESGSVVITDGIAAIQNAPHPNAAAAFVEFAGSAKVQSLLANEQNRIPTLTAALSDAPAWMAQEIQYMDIDWKLIAEKQGEWMQKFDTEIRDASKDVAKK